jgi:UDPglucose 6-dehydrogenase
MQLSIYGAGYVGLVTGACFAELGHDVLVMDVNQEKISMLQQGQSPIYEEGLDDLIARNLGQRLKFTSDLSQAVAHGLFQFIAVGTPSAEDGSADLSYVLKVAEGIGKHLNEYKLIINKSTVALGTAEKVRHIIAESLKNRSLAIEFDVVSNPEFLKQGAAVADFMHPDRIIIGADSPRAIEHIKALYTELANDQQCLMIMDSISAELTKYAANAYLATRISFMNEMSRIAELYGADINHVRQGLSSDQRIGPHFLNAGCGFGGSCFPKDVRALNTMAIAKGFEPQILGAIEHINQRQKAVLFEKMQRYFGNDFKNKTVALWGLSFKPNTDDMREASSLVLIEHLCNAGVTIKAYDPVAIPVARKIFPEHPNIIFCEQRDDTLSSADALVIITEWDEFRTPNFAVIKEKLKQPVIFDGRNLYEPKLLREQGFRYYGIGRGDSV